MKYGKFTERIERRNQLCLERIRIEAELLPLCQNPEKIEQYKTRLKQIAQEIEQTYGDDSQQKAAL